MLVNDDPGSAVTAQHHCSGLDEFDDLSVNFGSLHTAQPEA